MDPKATNPTRVDPDNFSAKNAVTKLDSRRDASIPPGQVAAPGQARLHTYVRTDINTGVVEQKQFPQSEHKERMAEGWKRLEDVTGSPRAEDQPAAASPAAPTGTVAPVTPGTVEGRNATR